VAITAHRALALIKILCQPKVVKAKLIGNKIASFGAISLIGKILIRVPDKGLQPKFINISYVIQCGFKKFGTVVIAELSGPAVAKCIGCGTAAALIGSGIKFAVYNIARLEGIKGRSTKIWDELFKFIGSFDSAI